MATFALALWEFARQRCREGESGEGLALKLLALWDAVTPWRGLIRYGAGFDLDLPV